MGAPATFSPIQVGRLVTDEQRRVVESALALLGATRADWAASHGLDRTELSKMLNGHMVTRQGYVTALNQLVRATHPVAVGRRQREVAR